MFSNSSAFSHPFSPTQAGREIFTSPAWHPLSSCPCLATGSPGVAPTGNSSSHNGVCAAQPPTTGSPSHFFLSKPKPILSHGSSVVTLHCFFKVDFIRLFAVENAPSSVFSPIPRRRARLDKVILSNSTQLLAAGTTSAVQIQYNNTHQLVWSPVAL